jgi:hypothetical protein
MVTQLAREFGAYVIGTGRAADSRARGPRAQNFLSVSNTNTLQHAARTGRRPSDTFLVNPAIWQPGSVNSVGWAV